MSAPGSPAAADLAVVARQLGRQPRAVTAIAHHCPCGLPDVVQTAPRLPDGTPFPTLYYLTCPRASAAISKLEAAGVMREMTGRLRADADLRRRYEAAHRGLPGPASRGGRAGRPGTAAGRDAERWAGCRTG